MVDRGHLRAGRLGLPAAEASKKPRCIEEHLNASALVIAQD